jgi:hypothetical protein
VATAQKSVTFFTLFWDGAVIKSLPVLERVQKKVGEAVLTINSSIAIRTKNAADII